MVRYVPLCRITQMSKMLKQRGPIQFVVPDMLIDPLIAMPCSCFSQPEICLPPVGAELSLNQTNN
jgi:hypothetical protein